MSSGSYIASLLTPTRVAVLSATISSSAFLFGNLGCTLFGPVAYLKSLPASTGSETDASLSPTQRAQLWAFFYKGAMPVMLTLLGSSIVAFSSAAYFFSQAHGDSAEIGRNIAIIGTIASVFVPPFTVFKLGPTNKILLNVAAEKEEAAVHAKYVDRLIRKWLSLIHI